MFIRSKKAQTAIEYVTTYGWVILLLAIILVTLYALGLFNPSSFVVSQCVLPANFGCITGILASNGNFSFVLQQYTTAPINLTAVGCNTNATTRNMKVFTSPVYLPIGSNYSTVVSCYTNGTIFAGPIGAIYKGYLVVNYTDQITGYPHTVVGSLIQKVSAISLVGSTSTTAASTTSTTTSITTTTTSTSTSTTSTLLPGQLGTPSITPVNPLTLYWGNSTALVATIQGGSGKSPYAYNFIIVYTNNGVQAVNQLYSNVLVTSNTFTFTPNTDLIGTTLQANVIVTDNSVPQQQTNSTKSGTITVNVIQYVYCAGGSSASPGSTYYSPISTKGYLGLWKSSTSYPVGLTYAGCSIYNGYIYCVGSFSAGPSYNYAYYAPVSSSGIGSWTATTSYPTTGAPGFYGAGCSIYNGYIYCVGNYAEYCFGGPFSCDNTPQNRTYYAPVSSSGIGAWTQSVNYPFPVYFSGCSIYNSYIYCVGDGYTFAGNQAYYAPISTNGVSVWTSTTSYPIPLTNAGCSISNGYIYCVGTGGRYGSAGAGNSTKAYYAQVSSTGISAWLPTTNYPIGLNGTGCTTYNNYIYCVGNHSSLNGKDVYYAPISGSGIGAWTATTSYPLTIDNQGYCQIPGTGGGYLGGGGPVTGPTTTTIPYVFCGGYNALRNTYNSFYYAPITGSGVGTWTPTTDYPVRFDWDSCGLGSNNYIYCFSGSGAGNSLVYYAPLSTAGGFGSWTAGTHLPTQANPKSCSIYNNYAYCLTFPSGALSSLSPTLTYYAPLSAGGGVGAWTSGLTYPVNDAVATSCAIYNSYWYCHTNPAPGNVPTPSDLWYYAPILNPGIGSWASTASYPIGLLTAGCTPYNGYLYCIGTDSFSSPNYLDYYAPISSTGIGTWSVTTNYPLSSPPEVQCTIYNGNIYCVGGSGASGVNYTYYAPVSSSGIGAWTASTRYPIQTDLDSCVVTGGGGGLQNGGGPNSGPTTSTAVSTSTSINKCPPIC